MTVNVEEELSDHARELAGNEAITTFLSTVTATGMYVICCLPTLQKALRQAPSQDSLSLHEGHLLGWTTEGK